MNTKQRITNETVANFLKRHAGVAMTPEYIARSLEGVTYQLRHVIRAMGRMSSLADKPTSGVIRYPSSRGSVYCYGELTKGKALDFTKEEGYMSWKLASGSNDDTSTEANAGESVNARSS